MRKGVGLMVASLAFLLVTSNVDRWQRSAWGDPQAGSVAGGGDLWTHCVPQEGKPHTLVVVDPTQRAIGVYHIDSQTGELALKSVRNIHWDMQMTQFNSQAPLPQEIRSGLGK